MLDKKRIKYLRVSLTNACNLNCFYCRPLGSFNNIETRSIDISKLKSAIKTLYDLGVRKVRFTGGEPTLYPQLTNLIRSTKNIDSSIHTALTTNGLIFAKKAQEYARAGLDSVNISIDSINESKFKTITNRNKLKNVITGIEQAVRHIPTVKLNCVLIKGVNDDEIKDMIDFANNLGIDIRFIEFMPSKTHSKNNTKYISGDEIISRLPYPLQPIDGKTSTAARYYKSSQLDIRIGFINSVSHPFCSECNRIRLDSNGFLYGCLFSENSINLFEMLDNNQQYVEQEICNLLRVKLSAGYQGAKEANSDLPSFINLGG